MTAQRSFQIGDQVTVRNTEGVAFPGKTITGSEVWKGYTETRYFYTPSDSPWFSVPGSRLSLESAS